MNTNALEIRFQKELERTPDPVQFALVFPERIKQAITKAKTTEEANNIRALADMGDAYLRQTLPRITQDRHERYLLMYPTESAYLDASRKAGVLWATLENRAGRGGDKKSQKYHSENFRNDISATEAGFKNDRDSVACQRISALHEQDYDLYKNECIQNERHMTINGAERVWHLLNPKTKTPSLPDGRYRVIYADPPWEYSSGDQHSNETQATVLGTHYPSMSIDELCKLPIREISEDESVLFMWTTSPVLEEAFDVIRAWGFKYKASVIWDKQAHNVGHYVSVRHELLLICTRGSCLPDSNTLLPSVVSEKRKEHSVKPETFRKMIDTMYPFGNRIELFARQEAEGWEAWGNEMEKEEE